MLDELFNISVFFSLLFEAKDGTMDNQKENNKHNDDDNGSRNKEEAE